MLYTYIKVMEAFLLITFLLSAILASVGVVRPSVFGRFYRRTGKGPGRKKLGLLFGSIALVSLISFGVTLNPSLKSINLSEGQETLEERYLLKGEYIGSPTNITVNEEKVELRSGTFERQLILQPGANKVVVALTKDDKELERKEYNIYYDYEGMLQAEEQRKEDEEIAKQASRVPEYEVTRKDGITHGFSAVVYIDEKAQDFLVANTVKDIKEKNSDTQTISLLIFEKADKSEVEKIFESTELAGIPNMVRANYEKRNDKEELFYFPTGLEGEKLALEL